MNLNTANIAKKTLSVVALLLAVVGVAALSGLTNSPNFATSTEHWSQLFFDGYVQCQPSFIDNGRHAARGFFVYRNGRDGERWAFTSYGQNAADGAIYSASMRYWDTLDPFAPPVTFNYGFDWVPFGSGIWPVAIIEVPADALGSDE